MRLPRLIINFRGQVVAAAPNSPPTNGYVRADVVTKFEDDAAEVVRAQHEAIDRLFVMLINATRGKLDDRPFMPSQCGQPWDAAQAGAKLLERLPQDAASRPDFINRGRPK